MKRQEKNEIYSIRKLKVGVGSALIGLSFLGTSGLINDVSIIKDVVGIHSVYAAEATSKPEGKVIAQGEDGVPWELYENGYLLFKPVPGKDTLSNNKGDITWKREHGSKIKHVGFAGKVYAPEDSSALFSQDYLEEGLALKSLLFNPITLDVSNLDTSKVKNMIYMFYNLSNLKNLDVTKFNTSNVTNMGGMFANASNLVNLDVTHFDTNKVTNMASMFTGMSKLNNLDVTKFDTSNVTDMQSMFRNLSNLTKLDVTKLNTSKVTNMNSMFSGMSELTDLDVTHFDTSEVTDMSAMFSDMYKLSNLDVRHFKTNKVTGMGNMFHNLVNLTNLNVTNFDTSEVKNMIGMFYGMSSLTDLDVTNFDTNTVIDMDSIFKNMKKLKELKLGDKFKSDGISTVTSNHDYGDQYTDKWHKANDKDHVYTVSDWAAAYGSNPKTTAGTWVREIANVPDKVEVIKSKVVYEKDPNREKGDKDIIIQGRDGQKVTPVTREKDSQTGKLVEKLGEPKITPATNTVIKVAAKDKVETKEIPSPKRYEADVNKDYGSQNDESKGKVGSDVTTTVYTVNLSDGKITEKSTTKHTDPTPTIVKIGTKPKVVTKVDDKGRKITETTTYTVDPNTGKVTSSTTTSYGDKASTVEKKVVPSPKRYEKDPTREKGFENIVVKGKDGEDQITTTYVVDSKTSDVTPSVGEPVRIVNPTETIIKVAAKDKVETKEIPSPKRYEADVNKDYGSQNDESKGKVGSDVTTTVYTVNPSDGKITEKSTTKHTDPTPTIVKIGTKPKVVTKVDDKGRKVTETTTYTVDPNTGKVTSSTTTSYGDKASTVEKKVVPSPKRYEKDPTREKGSENIVVKGKDGEDQITTTYVVDSKTGNVTPYVGKPVRTINPTETLIKVAAKDKVETIRKNGDTIERIIRYTVNPENGEISEETIDKLISSNGNGIKPPVVENNDFNGGVNGDLDGNSLLNEKPEYTGVIAGNGLDDNGNIIEPPVLKIPEFNGGVNVDIDGNSLINEKPNFDSSKIKRPYLGTGLNDFGPKKESNKDNIQFVPMNDNNHSNDNKIDSNIKEFKGSDKLDNEKPISKLPHTAGENNMVLNALGALTIATVLGVSISKYKKEN